MKTELKIIITLLVMWFIAHCAAFPETKFSEWGVNKFGSYTNFIVVLLLFFFTPILLIALYLLWSL